MAGEAMYVFAEKLKRLGKTLIVWNKCQFGQLGQNILQAEVAVKVDELCLEVDDSNEAID